MKHILYKRYEDLSDKQHWYLERYLDMSEYFQKGYELKETYRLWFEEAKGLTPPELTRIKQRLYAFYDLLECSGVQEIEKAIGTFKN